MLWPFKSIGRVVVLWVALMSGAVALGVNAFLGYLDATGHPVSHDASILVWGDAAAIAFVISVALAFWAEHSLVIELRRQLDARPDAEVTVDDLGLVVLNRGGQADFQAEIRVKRSQNFPALIKEVAYDAI